MKDRYNLKERENYNLSKKEEGSTQRCFSEEHQRLIEEAFRHFNMIGDLPKIIRQAVYELTTGISIQDDLSGDRS